MVLLKTFFAARPVKKAYLFGSCANGNSRKDSDIDILVELDHSKPIGMQIFVFQNELEDLLKTKVDLVTTEGLSLYVRRTIDKEKVLIYDRAVV